MNSQERHFISPTEMPIQCNIASQMVATHTCTGRDINNIHERLNDLDYAIEMLRSHMNGYYIHPQYR